MEARPYPGEEENTGRQQHPEICSGRQFQRGAVEKLRIRVDKVAWHL
jgi:hypothetical protein